jgi:glycosyltransferase involved in cell wall biosynthesis
MIPLTALVLTKDEQENIGRTLSAITWIDKVLMIDSFSSDETLEVARRVHPNVVIVQRAFDTHARQWNFGLEQVETDWVLSLDADYEISPELANEIKQLMPPEHIAGYEVDFEYRIHGRALRASVYPARVVLFRKQRCTYYDDGHTQKLRANGMVGKLRGKIYHDDRKPFNRWLEAQKKYAKLEAAHLRARSFRELSGPDKLRRMIFFAAPAMFFYTLFVQGLILDGLSGWVYVWQRTIAEALLSKELILGQDRQ